VVLDDRVLVAVDLPEGGRPVQVVGADEQRCAAPVSAALDDPVEEVGEFGRAAGHEGLGEVGVDLRGDHERGVQVGEVAEGALQEVRVRHVVRVHLGDHVVLVLVRAAPGVVVAVLGAGLERPVRPVPLRAALSAEVPDAEPLATAPDLRVVTFVQQPDVEDAVVPDPLHRAQRRHDQFDRLLARDDRGQHGHAQAGRWCHRDRVAGPRGEERQHPGAQRHDDLHGDHDSQAHDRENDHHGALRAQHRQVARQQQIHPECHGQDDVHQTQRAQNPVLSTGVGPPVLDLVPGGSQRPGYLGGGATVEATRYPPLHPDRG